MTPKVIIDILGPFDLDPCAAPDPRPWNTAAAHLTETDDGLSKPWEGFVWLNPPYGDEIFKWTDRLKAHGNGIALVFSRTDTQWFQRAIEGSSLVLFVARRLKFHKPDGTPGPHKAGAPSAFIAYGEEAKLRLLRSGIEGIRMEWRP